MKTEDEILKEVFDEVRNIEGTSGDINLSREDIARKAISLSWEKATSQARQECGLEQTEKIMIAFEKGKQAERQECEIEKHKYAILCMRGREKEIEQAERKECEWKQQANYNAGFEEGQKKDFEKEVVSYYKGKKVTDADALLLRAAVNNFKAGQQAEQKRILEIIYSWAIKHKLFQFDMPNIAYEALKKEVEKK